MATFPDRVMHEIIPLNHLPTGQLAAVSDVVGQPDAVHRLEELGLRRGAEIEMVQHGSPCIVRLAGQKLCLRADQLFHVLVRLGATA